MFIDLKKVVFRDDFGTNKGISHWYDVFLDLFFCDLGVFKEKEIENMQNNF